MTNDIVLNMRWHESLRVKDEMLRHPLDYESWKTFNVTCVDFTINRSNVRLALSTDSFESFNLRSITVYDQLHFCVYFQH